MHTTVKYRVNSIKLDNGGETTYPNEKLRKEYSPSVNHHPDSVGSKPPEATTTTTQLLATAHTHAHNNEVLTNGRGPPPSEPERGELTTKTGESGRFEKTGEPGRFDVYNHELANNISSKGGHPPPAAPVIERKNEETVIVKTTELNSVDLTASDDGGVKDSEGGGGGVKDGDGVVKDGGGGGKTDRVAKQQFKIERLKEELKCEEATLNLLRKLFDSQRGKNSYKPAVKYMPVTPSLHPKQPAQIQPRAAPPPRPQHVQSGKQGSAQPVNQAPVQKYYIQVGNQLVPAPPPNSGSGGPIYQYANGGTPNSHNNYQPAPPPKPAPPPPPKETPEQKQNAAKAALRRQLEQTLLQIPPPRPPPADWKAIPNVNSMDFMMLVGLDEVVDNILDMDNKPTLKNALEELLPYNPRICSQCTVDFSPCWKNKEGDSKNFVLCERCALQNIKKDLKAEHTFRLKSAFMKALKQEQEIEEKIKAGEDINIGSITGATSGNNEKTSTTPSAAGGSEKSQSPVTNNPVRISSPKSVQPTGGRNSSNNTGGDGAHHQSPTGHHHGGRPVVQHYPHHSPLVQQLHHQHMQQQQLEQDPPQRHSSRWHPYLPAPSGHHHREHHQGHHRTSSSAEAPPPPHQEYYVVHHPQHAGGVRYINR